MNFRLLWAWSHDYSYCSSAEDAIWWRLQKHSRGRISKMVSKIYLMLIMIMAVISMEMLMGFALRGRTAGKEQTHKRALFTHIPNQAFANMLISLYRGPMRNFDSLGAWRKWRARTMNQRGSFRNEDTITHPALAWVSIWQPSLKFCEDNRRQKKKSSNSSIPLVSSAGSIWELGGGSAKTDLLSRAFMCFAFCFHLSALSGFF